MVTVDMSTARAQITKRQRRMRRAAHRRLQKQQRAQLREHRAAEAAHRARQRAIARWNAEEDRLQRLRDQQRKPSHSTKPNSKTNSKPSRAVQFAQNVIVTEIPVRDADKLPNPVTSPIGVSICGTDDSDDDNMSPSNHLSSALPFAQLSDSVFADDDEDPEFTPDQPVQVNMRTAPIQRPRRRIVVKRLDVPLDQIIPPTTSTIPKQKSPPKRPRPETTQTPNPSPAANGVQDCDNLHAKPSPEHDSTPSKTRKSSKRKTASDTGSPDRPKSKRRRLYEADHQSPSEKKLKGGNDGEDTINTVHANGVDRSVDAPKETGKGGKTSKEGQPSSEASDERKHTDRVLLISSTKNAERKKRIAQQISSSKNKSKKTDKSSACTAIRDSPRKKPKPNGEHSAIPNSDQHDKPSESDDDQDLEDMFGNLVRMKAANRAIHEKKTKLEKLSQNGENISSVPGQRAKSKPKKSPSRYTDDGLRIMTYEEIAADQPPGLNGECPFDCSCCF